MNRFGFRAWRLKALRPRHPGRGIASRFVVLGFLQTKNIKARLHGAHGGQELSGSVYSSFRVIAHSTLSSESLSSWILGVSMKI